MYMAINRTISSNFANNVLFERSLETFTEDDVKMNFESSFSSDFAELKGSLKRIELCCHGEGDGKCGTMCALIAEAVQKSREKLSTIENKMKALVGQNQVVVNNVTGFTNSAQHVSTFYKSATGPVEVVPAPEFRSAEAFSPPPLVSDSALKVVKSPKRKPRQRDRKSRKPQVPVRDVKSEEDGKIPDDGFCWRKYGSKNIKTAIYKKAYYRCNAPCSQNRSKKCRAKKTVQQANNDPTVLHVAYDSPHSCKLASEVLPCPSQEELDKTEGLNLAEQLLSNVNAHVDLISTTSTTDWAQIRLDQFNIMRTSSGTFSAVSEEELEGGTDALEKLEENSGLVNGDSGEFRDLSDLIETGLSWTRVLDSTVTKSQYMDVDPNQLLMDHIVQGGHTTAELQEQDSHYRNSYMSHIQDWHPHGN